MKKSNKIISPELARKLKTYSAAAGAFLVVGQVDGQVVFTDIDDTTVTGAGTYALDLDQDASPDMKIQVNIFTGDGTSTSVTVAPIGTADTIEFKGDSTYSRPYAINSNVSLSSNGYWFKTPKGLNFSSTTSYGSVNGYWQPATNKYLGVKIKIAGDWHYGWVKMSVVANGTQFTVHEFAYETQPNTMIKTGGTVNWTGTIDTDWNTAGNWANGSVPTSTMDVVIGSGGNQPTISAANAYCNRLTISSGAVITISSAKTLSVNSDLTDIGGDFSIGSGSQAIVKGNLKNNFNEVKMISNSTNGLIINGNIDIEQGAAPP